MRRTHCALFKDTIQNNDLAEGPAKAMQTLYTVLMQMAYYDYSPQFDVSGPAEMSVARLATVPSQ